MSLVEWLITAGIVGILVLLIMDASIDRGECLQSHYDYIFISQRIGNATILTPYPTTVCDKWEFPDGKHPKEQPK